MRVAANISREDDAAIRAACACITRARARREVTNEDNSKRGNRNGRQLMARAEASRHGVGIFSEFFFFQDCTPYEFRKKTKKMAEYGTRGAHLVRLRAARSLVFRASFHGGNTRGSIVFATVSVRGTPRANRSERFLARPLFHARASRVFRTSSPSTPARTQWPPWRAPRASPRSTPSSSTACPPRRSYCASHLTLSLAKRAAPPDSARVFARGAARGRRETRGLVFRRGPRGVRASPPATVPDATRDAWCLGPNRRGASVARDALSKRDEHFTTTVYLFS